MAENAAPRTRRADRPGDPSGPNRTLGEDSLWTKHIRVSGGETACRSYIRTRRAITLRYMAFAREHLLLRAIGTFGLSANTKNEEWTAGMRIMVGASGFTEANKAIFLESVATPFSTFHSGSDVSAHTTSWLTALSAAYIGTDGKYVGGAAQETTIRPYGSPSAGVGATAASWDQCRTFTLRTDRGRGRAHVGRFFWPCALALSNDGRWTAIQSQDAAGAAKLLLDAVNNAAESVWPEAQGVYVFSKIAGDEEPVTRVEVGRAPDTQRRRTRSLLEEYQGQDLAAAARHRGGREFIDLRDL